VWFQKTAISPFQDRLLVIPRVKGVGGSLKAINCKGKYEPRVEFTEGHLDQNPSMGWVWMFSGTAEWKMFVSLCL